MWIIATEHPTVRQHERPQDALGVLPSIITSTDEPVREQLNARYAYGGGFFPSSGWHYDHATLTLRFEGEPPLDPLACALLRDEICLLYPSAWLCIVNRNDPADFAVCRVD